MTWVMIANRPAVIDTNGGTVFATSDVPHPGVIHLDAAAPPSRASAASLAPVRAVG